MVTKLGHMKDWVDFAARRQIQLVVQGTWFGQDLVGSKEMRDELGGTIVVGSFDVFTIKVD